MIKTLKLAVVACLAGLILPVHAQDSWQNVVDAAKKESKLVIYDMALGAPYFTAVLKSFQDKYGIPVESLDLRASELSERIRTEQAAGRYLGDVEMISSTMIEEQRQNGDFIEKLGLYFPKEKDPAKKLKVDMEAVKAWEAKGALATRTVGQLLKAQPK